MLSKLGHVPVVHVSEQRGGWLRQRVREVAQGGKLAFGAWLVDTIEIRRPEKAPYRLPEGRELFAWDEAIGDIEQDDRNTVVVRRRPFRHRVPLDSRAEVLEHA